MKIIEVRDGFIKIEADNSIYPSALIRIDGENKKYFAQINQVKNIGNVYIASAKMLFVYDGKEYINYDKTEPPMDSYIEEVTEDVIKQFVKYETPIIIGKTADNKNNICFDSSAFDKKTVISADNIDNINTIVKNLSAQFNNAGKKTLIIDTIGNIQAKKYKAGEDFKLPLDTESLIFLYNECLNEATSDSKAMISSIFKDLSEYSESVPFVPFETLKFIVDNMVENDHILKLFVLKNKLAKLQKYGYFAANEEQVNKCDAILNSACSIIDLSEIKPAFQSRFLSFICKKAEKHPDIQILLIASNSITKKNLKEFFTNDSIATTLVAHSGFVYLSDMKRLFNNFIIEANQNNIKVFREYENLLRTVNQNCYLTVGEASGYIPFISEFQTISETILTENSQGISGSEINDISDDELANEFQNSEEDSIISSIDKHSDNVIKSISEEIETADENREIENLFDNTEPAETEDDEDTLEYEEDNQEQIIENDDEDIIEEDAEEISDNEETEQNTTDEDIIEPEYTEIEEISENENTVSEQNTDTLDIKDESDTEYSEDNSSSEIDIPDESNDSESIEEQSSIPDEEIELDAAGDEELLQEDYSDSDELSIDIGADLSEDITEIDSTYTPDKDIDTFNETENVSVIPSGNDSEDDNLFDEIVELDPDDADNNDIIVDMSDDENTVIDDETEQEIINDVDKVYTTAKDDGISEEISDSDLDFIDELNDDDNTEVLEETTDDENLLEDISDNTNNGILEEIPEEEIIKEDNPPEILEKRDSSTPIVPVYEADIPQEDLVMSDPIQQGDAVIHAKYGTGVVEKMIKYGSKTLFSINFDNIGRRLLDPTLTEIKKA